MYKVMMTKEASTKTVNFMTLLSPPPSLGQGFLCLGVAIMWKYNIISPPSDTGAWLRQIKYIAMIAKEGPTKIVNFMTLGDGVLMLRCGHMSHYSEYALSSTLSMYSKLIAFVLRVYNAAFLWFLFILWRLW